MPNVAIVGIGCRFPGGIDGPDSFWDLVVRKGDGIVEVPADRWNLAKFYDPDPDAPGRMYTRHGGFLTQSLWEFDAEFFGISQREASIMDPQQRLLLEVAWEALDDAGMAGRVGGREVGVFVGGFMNDNALVRSGSMSRASINSHSPTSSSHTLLSARIAFLLDLLGPTMTIDTACSSSLVALHQAVLALESGECESAIVGGANAMLRPEAFISMCKGRFLAVDGRCKSFDAAADGYGRGEGAGAVVLKTLDAAVRDRDRIYAVVRGSGVNQDGRTLAIPVPNPVAQEALARRVHRLAGIDAHDIRFVEAHGTGTPVGDPLELAALGAVYGAVDGRDEPLPVGSVKNNIGHTEAAAGVAGVIKAALTLHHGVIAPQRSLDNPNPEIRFDELRVRIPLATEPLPNDDGRAAVAVNSFGYGGTNAHAILIRAPELPAPADAARTPITVLPLSARNETALRTMATQLHDLTETAPVDAVTEAAWTQRAHHPLRAAFGYRDAEDLRVQLADFAAGAGKSPARALTDGSTQPVFVFSGMGPQWWGMARGLLEAGGHFAAAAGSIDVIFHEIAGWSIVEELLRPEEESRITRTAFAQPANFLVQAALLAELAELGIHPAAVVGHSVGEVTSAYASGSLSLRDALLVSYHRARLQATTAGTGGMLAVGLAEEQLHERLAGVAGVCVAAINSHSAATLSGDLAELDRIRAELTEEGVFAKALRVEVPYHSHLMDPILGDLTTVLAGLTPQPARVPIWSTVTGGELSGPDWDAEYWCRNVREPVRFGAAVDSLLDAGHRVFLEVGPHPVLSGNLKEAFVRRGLDGAAISTLSRDADDHDNLLRAVGELYQVGGLDTTHAPGVPETPAAHLDLPRYPWQRRTLWTEDPAIEADRVGATDGYVMLGQRTAASAPEWEVELSVAALPWLPDHVVDGSVVLPGAAYLDAALSAVAVRTGRTSFGLESVQFVAPLVIAQHDVPVLRLTVEETTHRFTLRSRAATATTWTVNAHGRLIEADVDARTIDLTPAADAVDVAAATLYDGLAAHGLAYGPSFRLITAARVGADSVLARLDLAPLAGSAPSLPHLAHPAAVDAALQCFAALYAQTAHGASVVVPSSVAGVRWTGPLPEQAVVLVRRVDGDPLCADITVATPEGAVVLALTGVRFASLAAEPDLHDHLDGLFYEPVWSIVDDPATADEPPGGEEFLLVVSLGSTVSQRAKEIASARAASELLTVAPEQTGAADRVLATLRAARERPGVTRSRLVVVSGAELDAVPNAYGLALVAKAVGELVVGEEDDAAAAEVRAVVVTEQAFCLPIDAFAHPAQAALTGARRTLRNEQPAVQWRLVDTEPATRAADIVEQVLGDGRADEVALRAGACWALHLRKSLREHLAAWDEAAPLTDPEGSFRLEIPRSRLLSDLAWRAVERVAPGPGEVEIRMDAVGLNYKDALKALGVLTEKELAGTYFGTALGMDGFGVVERVGPGVTEVAVGDEMSVCAKDLVRRHVTLRPDEGATMPLNYPDSVLDPCHSSSVLPFLTAEFAFGELAHLQPGETVLVHGAAGGMGMAAVQVAVRLGARVIATAGSDERRAVAAAAGAHEVVNSRSISFVDDVLTLTDGRGVDVVYNSSPGEILQQNLRAAAEFGRIIEIGKADIYGGGAIDLRPFDRNLSFFAVDMDRALAVRPELVRRAARRAMDALNDGTYEYLPYTAFTLDNTAEAFETVVRSKQIGRVVLDLREPEPTVLAARPGLPIDPAASYLVTGGFGAFGLATARWLVRIGARRLVLAGRSGATTDAARAAIAEFTAAGAEVVEERLDMADYDAVAALIERIQAGGHPLRGVFHAAGVVNNLEVPQITAESLAEIFGPKVAGAVNLDTAVTAADIELDMFVLFSSASSIVGISPQFGYAAANSVLDMIAAARRARGAAALAVNWGFMSGGGGMADYEAVSRYAEMTGYRSVDMDLATDLLGECLRLDLPQIVLFDVDWSQWALAHRPSTRTPRFADQVAAAGGGASGAGALRAEILQVGLEQRGEVVAYLLAEQLAAVLGVDAETVDLNTPLPELGMDSLMGMEFGARVVQVLGTQLSVLAVIGLTLRGLGARIAEQIAQEEERAARSEDE
ncbi:SDR family NAD(P)-dependent oxidoreductase [Nocardia abscessus]|uniref:SDR family NAD(P)-dependent oxidoreductase n=1 Tax=Nocardia abscessus TaxID=120957 RepID=A0ABS0C4S6_9NOCA|nr:type I polyketide synthase [Nocardia abscessus]MBF6225156.1 SDR family NAD(P)-dependent oxidoreductase [Nocardia abscessus]